MKKKRTTESRPKATKKSDRVRATARRKAAKVEAAARAENRRLGVSDNWYESAYLVSPPPKERISIRLDEDVLEFFRSDGRGYQAGINAVLRAFVEAQKRG